MLKNKFSNIKFPKLLLRTLSVINKKGKKKLSYLILLVCVQAFFDVLSLASLMPLIQVITNKDSLKSYTEKLISLLNIDLISSDITLSIYIPLIVILLMIISTIIRLYVVYKTNKFIEETRHHISTRLMDGYIKSDINLNINSSEIAKSILSEVDQFIIIVFQPTMLFLTNILVLVAIILYLLFSNFLASIISLLLLITFYANFYLFSKRKLNFEGYKSEKANKGRFKTAIESLQLIKDIKIYSAEEYFSNRFRNYSKIFANTNATYSTLVASPKYILEMLVFVTLAFSILLISLSNSEQTNSLPLLGLFAFAAYRAQPALSNVIYGINSLEYGSKIITNLYISLKKSKSKSHDKKNSINNIRNSKNISNSNSLIIKNLKYIYDKNNKGIKNINLNIKNPSLFILVGPSGSGKSTLLNLISGNLKAQEGELYFSRETYKRSPKIAFLHQEFGLYDASISENVAFGIKKENINYRKIKEVLIKAEIYEYVQSLKNKLDTRVGENGSNLSIGQKQRIALARSLYFKPDILLLDEPTSGLDINNEKKIMQTILNLSKEIIIIMATHKLKFIPENTKIGYLHKSGISIEQLKNFNKK